MPIGLWGELTSICKEYVYPLKIDGLDGVFDFSIKKENVKEFYCDIIDRIGYDEQSYQWESVYRFLKYRYCTLMCQ